MSIRTTPRLDQLSDISSIGAVDMTRDEYMKSFSQASYLTPYDRSNASPTSGFYDTMNTSTNLILLNQRFKNSHLREQVIKEEKPCRSKNKYEYESVFELDQPKPKEPIKKILSHQTQINPNRHFQSQTKYWHNHKCTNRSLYDNSINLPVEKTILTKRSQTSHSKSRKPIITPRRSRSVLVKVDKSDKEPEPSFTKLFCEYYREVLERCRQTYPDLQQKSPRDSAKKRLLSNKTVRKSPLTEYQELYLLGKYHVYDAQESKIRRSNSYSQILRNRFKTDYNYKPEYHLNDRHDYLKYTKYVKPPGSRSSSSFSIRSNQSSKQSVRNDNSKPLIVKHNHQRTPLIVRLRQQ